MNSLDHQNPDISLRGFRYEIVYDRDRHETIVELRSPTFKRYVVRVFAKRGNHPHTYGSDNTWDCANTYRDGTCGYYGGWHDMPPMPDQRCQQCKNLLAEMVAEPA